MYSITPPVSGDSIERRLTGVSDEHCSSGYTHSPLQTLLDKYHHCEPIVMVTAYDYPGAIAAQAAGVDMILVGDSAAMTVLGYDSTTDVGMEEMLLFTGAVARGAPNTFIVGDMPSGSYDDPYQAAKNARRFVDIGASAVKLEGGSDTQLRCVQAIAAAGIDVIGHIGLTPQTADKFVAQGRTADAALTILREALSLQHAGASMLVFEAIPSDVSKLIVARLSIPVIGIGAGDSVDGQVLVFHDILGIRTGKAARFVQEYALLLPQMQVGLQSFADDVRSRQYPQVHHGYSIPADELERFAHAAAAEPAPEVEDPWLIDAMDSFGEAYDHRFDRAA